MYTVLKLPRANSQNGPLLPPPSPSSHHGMGRRGRRGAVAGKKRGAEPSGAGEGGVRSAGPHCHHGEAVRGSGGGGRGRGGEASPPGKEEREGREGLHVREREDEEIYGNNGERAHRTRRPCRSREEKTSFGDESSAGSTNRRHQDEFVDEMNTTVPSDSVDDARI
jgi:hypothetical protein